MKYDPSENTFALKFENVKWIRNGSENDITLTQLDLVINGVENLNVDSVEMPHNTVEWIAVKPRTISLIDERIYSIGLTGNNTISILTEERDSTKQGITTIKFNAKNVDIAEIVKKLKDIDEWYSTMPKQK
jgi:hypothetical protein